MAFHQHFYSQSNRSRIMEDYGEISILIHFFSFYQLQNVFRLIRIRNPWGTREWNGRWSDDSSEWQKLSDRDRERLHVNNDGEPLRTTYNECRQFFIGSTFYGWRKEGLLNFVSCLLLVHIEVKSKSTLNSALSEIS